METVELQDWQQAIKEAVTLLDGHAGVARVLGYEDRRNVWPWTSGARMLPADMCPAIELAVGGKVVVERLNPETSWVRVKDPKWPHPKGRPCIDVAKRPDPQPAEQGAA